MAEMLARVHTHTHTHIQSNKQKRNKHEKCFINNRYKR